MQNMHNTPEADLSATIRKAVQSADPKLSKFKPLPRILAHDEFNSGLHGWVELGGNYNGKGEYESLTGTSEIFAHRSFRPATFSMLAHTERCQERMH